MDERAGAGTELASHPQSHLQSQLQPFDVDVERHLPAPAAAHVSPDADLAVSATSRSAENGTTSTAFLDGLRGLAAFFVFFQHCIGGFDDNVHEHGFGEGGHWHLASLPFVRILFNGGGAAVAIFFVLSGFVLSRSPLRLVRAAKTAACLWSLASAVVRRPIRLYAPTFAVTLAFAVLMHAPYHLVHELPWPQRKPDVFQEVANWVVSAYHYFNPFQTHSNEVWFDYGLVVWTIPIELKGSMLIYALAALLAAGPLSAPRSMLAWSISIVVLLQLGYWTMACFLAGLVLSGLDVYALDASFLSRHCSQLTRTVLHHLAFVAGYYLLCQPAHGGDPDYSLNTPGWRTLTRLAPAVYGKNQYYRYWTSWGAALLVYATLRLRWLQALLQTRPLRYLGRVSFMFYLIHLPMQYIVGDRVALMLGHVPKDAEPTWWDNRLYVPDLGPPGFNTRFLLSMAVMFPLDLVVADFLTRWLDMPCVRLGKRLTQRLGIEQRVAVASRKAEGV
ncbi:bebe6dc2-fd64-4d3b-84d4-a8a74ff6ba18 [Thermothielavioides terrestris]|uniref:Bebe6dc2-fd64-4d3b-84d4-a8a74ff6ba18 n=1 Tax=Thermothielavioides terrestris TaxID=2587410 RepID=A0A446B7K2_9PEZI|nr:bebe6dc2-fd64-4d3b-84d4-a8a74ff6ba18 [Thermothielavioides terrestris]